MIKYSRSDWRIPNDTWRITPSFISPSAQPHSRIDVATKFIGECITTYMGDWPSLALESKSIYFTIKERF